MDENEIFRLLKLPRIPTSGLPFLCDVWLPNWAELHFCAQAMSLTSATKATPGVNARNDNAPPRGKR